MPLLKVVVVIQNDANSSRLAADVGTRREKKSFSSIVFSPSRSDLYLHESSVDYGDEMQCTVHTAAPNAMAYK